MRSVICAPKLTGMPKGYDKRFMLYAPSSRISVGSIGAHIPSKVSYHRLRPSARAWDFLSIALSVVAADEGCTRSDSPDGWTRVIGLTVSVVDEKFWTENRPRLEQILRFLTGDIWQVSFIGGGFLPKPRRDAVYRDEEAVCLLSGGMDSLIGAIDCLADGRRPLLVSQIAKGDKRQQQYFAQKIAPKSLHLQLNHTAKFPYTSERSQRARSLCFLGYAVLAATSLRPWASGKTIDIIVPENGFISLNVPLTPLRIGSLSTRTTHPYFVRELQLLLERADLRVRLANPYQWATKGEMLASCRNQKLLRKLVGWSTSCGRYARSGFKQCGRCVPCLIRRAAFHHWGRRDTTDPYLYSDLSKADRRHKDFDDVRSAAMAYSTMKTRGLAEWLGGAINSTQMNSPKEFREVAQRGLEELGSFLRAQGAV